MISKHPHKDLWSESENITTHPELHEHVSLSLFKAAVLQSDVKANTHTHKLSLLLAHTRTSFPNQMRLHYMFSIIWLYIQPTSHPIMIENLHRSMFMHMSHLNNLCATWGEPTFCKSLNRLIEWPSDTKHQGQQNMQKITFSFSPKCFFFSNKLSI